jgi:hypothetical protein
MLSADRAGGVLLTVRGDRAATGALLAEFFEHQGWRVQETSPARLDVETGSLGRTALLGAFAGRRFHLRARLELSEAPGGTRIRYRWGASVGRALGGAVGWARAGRLHAETAEALVARLRADGFLIDAAPER